VNFSIEDLKNLSLQEKLYITIAIFVIFVIFILIYNMVSYEPDLQSKVEEFIMATENLNTDKLLAITGGTFHENLVKRNDTIKGVKRDVSFRGSIIEYNIKILEKQSYRARVEVTAKIRENLLGRPSTNFKHIFLLDFIKSHSEWKVAKVTTVNTEIVP